MSQTIEIVEKPSSISYDEIADIVNVAFSSVENEGVRFGTSHIIGKELQELIAKKTGKCFVALDGDKAIATATVVNRDLKEWYKKGKCLRLRYVAVYPNYAGRHIGSNLIQACLLYAQRQGFDILNVSTPANNLPAQKMYDKTGFMKVKYWCNKDHDVIDYAYWIDSKRPSKLNCTFHYCLSVMKSKVASFLH